MGTLKKKWQDPEFRETMMAKFKNRRSSGKMDSESRLKKSEAMKVKWQDETYRERAMNGMAKWRKTVVRPTKLKVAPKPRNGKTKRPVRDKALLKKKIRIKEKKKTRSLSKAPTVDLDPSSRHNSKQSHEELEEEQRIRRMKTEKRHLYNALYGDDSDENGNKEIPPDIDKLATNLLADLFEPLDDDLDNFDPYGLDE